MADLKKRLDPRTLPAPMADGLMRAITAAAARQLDEPDFRLVMAEFINRVPAASLPALVRELSLEDLVEPGMREDVVRGLLKQSVALHLGKGTVAGVRAVLALLGVSVRWVQWFDMQPKGRPGTHKVTAFPSGSVFDAGDTPLSPRVAALVRRAISNYKRKSQEIELWQGLTNKGAVYCGALAQSSRQVRINALRLGDMSGGAAVFAGVFHTNFKQIFISAKGR